MTPRPRKFWRAVACRLALHQWQVKMANVPEHQGKNITLGWFECRHCGESKLKLILSNWEGTTP